MNRHPDTLSKKSKTHTVDHVGGPLYQVTSGHTGSVYHVRLLDNGTDGATCDCDWSTKRHNILNCGCSHVVAVLAYIQAQQARTVAVHADYTSAQRQHRPMLHIGDGLTLTTRKA